MCWAGALGPRTASSDVRRQGLYLVDGVFVKQAHLLAEVRVEPVHLIAEPAHSIVHFLPQVLPQGIDLLFELLKPVLGHTSSE